MDLRYLTRGVSYKVCQDQDGASRAKAFGDSLQMVYINALGTPDRISVKREAGQVSGGKLLNIDNNRHHNILYAISAL
jgi:hypothetical protein